MHVVVDAVAVRSGSAAITLENVLRGWEQLGTGDRFTVLCVDAPPFELPGGARVQRMTTRLPGALGDLWLRSAGVRRAARALGADAMLSGVTASAFLGAPCPHGAIVYDLRHEFRPQQFSRPRRLARRLSYGWSFRSADGLYCISKRTRDDLVRARPSLRDKAVLARYGADHVDCWPAAHSGEDAIARRPYALAFGQFANKNVHAVLGGWADFCQHDQTWTLRLVGMGRADRDDAGSRVVELGIADRVELMPWLDDEEFVRCFAGASLVVFPSDFEGFGLPAVEALRLRIPLVISGDVALAEVTGGHAAVAPDVRPESIAAAIGAALALSPESLDAGRAYTDQFTWRSMAQAIRDDFVRRGAEAGPSKLGSGSQQP